MSRSAEIQTRLEAAFAPDRLEVRNDSAKHAGHAGHDGTNESHFHITLRAPAMAGLSRVARHRAVHKALGDLTAEIHSLSFDLDA